MAIISGVRVLVAHECSGIVREAFRSRGHDAWSCDIKPAEDASAHHILGSVLTHEVVRGGWDMLIAHPDCTFLTVSANAWAGEEWRIEARLSAMHHVRSLWAFPVPHKCIENPIGVLSTFWRRPDQTIQPHQFGEDASKATCRWLQNLPPLRPTGFVEPRQANGRMRWANQTDSGQNRLAPSERRSADRARTYPGIAEAMASQWST